MPTVPCPKPGCGWTVDPAAVPAGEVVACPRCGQRFRLTPASPPPAGGGRSAVLAVGGVLLAVAVLAGAVAAVAVARRNQLRPAPPAATDLRDVDRNFALTPPPDPWAADPALRNELGVNVAAFSRPQPAGAAWAGFAVRDFKTRVPLAGELRDAMTATLRRVFHNLPPEPPLEPTTWAGRPASVWRFRGEHRTTGDVCAGEAVALTDRGVGYWFYGWAAERDLDPAVLRTVRDGLRLLDERRDWSPAGGSEVPFRGRAAGYRLTAFEPVWQARPAGGPDAPDLELQGMLKGRGRADFPARAEVRAWVRPGAGDPATAAEALVRKENTRDPEVFGPTAFAELTDPPAGDAPPGPDGPPAAAVRRFKVTTGTPDAQTARLLAVAGATAGGALVVVEGSCPWDEREVWERRLVQLVGSVR